MGKKRRFAPPGWEEERKQRLRQQRRQKALRESSKLKPFPVTVTTLDGVVKPQKLTRQQERQHKYEAYIQSGRWERRKAEYYFLHEKVCWRCGVTSNIHLHHHTYVRLGNELNEDLVPLCQDCHRRVHDLHREQPGYDLTDATIEAIGEHPRHRVGFRVVLVEPTWQRGRRRSHNGRRRNCHEKLR